MCPSSTVLRECKLVEHAEVSWSPTTSPCFFLVLTASGCESRQGQINYQSTWHLHHINICFSSAPNKKNMTYARVYVHCLKHYRLNQPSQVDTRLNKLQLGLLSFENKINPASCICEFLFFSLLCRNSSQTLT